MIARDHTLAIHALEELQQVLCHVLIDVLTRLYFPQLMAGAVMKEPAFIYAEMV